MTRRTRPERKRNLEGLLGQDALDLTRPAHAQRHLPVTDLHAGKGQPRREFDDAALTSLAQSIQTSGVLQPLLVRPAGERYEIVAGERRWRAAQLAGLTEVPVVIRDLSDPEARQIALIENLQREDLNTVDEVDAKLELVAGTLALTREQARHRLMQLLREPHGPDHDALEVLFQALGEQWTSFARNKLKILNWPSPLLDAVRGGLPYTLAQLIAQVEEGQQEALITLAQSGATRDELKQAIRTLKDEPQVSPTQRVARRLGSARWLASLNDGEKKDLDAWLAKMPASIKRQLG